jgi:hypothetical protein
MEADILLQKICDATRRAYFPDLPEVKIVTRDNPFFESRKCIGFWLKQEKTIYLKPEMVIGVPFERIQNTIKHELVHAWVDWKGYPFDTETGGHGEHFIKKAIEVGVDFSKSGTFREYPKSKEIYDRLMGTKPLAPPAPKLVIHKRQVPPKPVQQATPKPIPKSQPTSVVKPVYSPPVYTEPAKKNESSSLWSFVCVLISFVGWIVVVLSVASAFGKDWEPQSLITFICIGALIALVSSMASESFRELGYYVVTVVTAGGVMIATMVGYNHIVGNPSSSQPINQPVAEQTVKKSPPKVRKR